MDALEDRILLDLITHIVVPFVYENIKEATTAGDWFIIENWRAGEHNDHWLDCWKIESEKGRLDVIKALRRNKDAYKAFCNSNGAAYEFMENMVFNGRLHSLAWLIQNCDAKCYLKHTSFSVLDENSDVVMRARRFSAPEICISERACRKSNFRLL